MSRTPLMFALLLSAVPALAQPPAADAAPARPAASADPLTALPEAKPLSFKAILERPEVALAEPFSYVLEVTHPAEDSYELPTLVEWKDFHERDRQLESTGTEPKTTRLRLTLQAFAVGERELPAIRLMVKGPQGARRLEVPPLSVKVTGVIASDAQTPELREQRAPLPRLYRTRWWPLWLLLAPVAAWLAWRWWKRRQQRALAAPPRPRPPAHEEALSRLEALEADRLVAAGRQQEHFFRVSEILRDYLGRRFGVDALESTTDELLSALRARSTPGLDFDALGLFLCQCDLVKFARFRPTDGECKGAVDSCRNFVLRTVAAAPAPSAQGPTAVTGGGR